MRILIVEDEKPTAEDLQQLVKNILGKNATSIHIETTVSNALWYLNQKSVDVVLLDLTLHSDDGFTVLRHFVQRSFQTIVISASISRAIEAYELGVFDFIPKPYTEERLRKSFERLRANFGNKSALQYLSVRKGAGVKFIPLSDVVYMKAAGMYVELYLSNSRVVLYDRSLKKLIPLLPKRFVRVHRSYIVDSERIVTMEAFSGGKYQIVLEGGSTVPVSRSYAREMRKLMKQS